jgi:lipopolysaccharide export system protein LptA
MTFHEQVHAAYSPVQDWLATLEGDDPRAFGPQAIILRSDHLTVVDMTPPGGDKSAEMLAFGNVVAEGAVFTARASRMTYSQANGLLVLDGDGRTDAELFRQEHPGSTASHFTARRILYWPKINQAKVDGVRTLELNQYPNGEVKSGARLPPGLNR